MSFFVPTSSNAISSIISLPIGFYGNYNAVAESFMTDSVPALIVCRSSRMHMYSALPKDLSIVLVCVLLLPIAGAMEAGFFGVRSIT